jgi:chromatin segregation and condensation protein Rec8/ScpA/Scc1 (kleisin family)
MKAFQEIMREFEAADVREIELEEYTIEEKIIGILEALRQDNQVVFNDLFASGTTRMELIVTLIALLELIKHAQVRVKQETGFGPIWLYRGENFGRPMGAPEDWDSSPVPTKTPEPSPAVAEETPAATSTDVPTGEERTADSDG